MKLVYCTYCGDIFNLSKNDKQCSCGKTRGKYVDNLNAEIHGPCVPLGFANNSFGHAMRNRPKTGMGSEFVAFVIPKQCDSIEHVEH